MEDTKNLEYYALVETGSIVMLSELDYLSLKKMYEKNSERNAWLKNGDMLRTKAVFYLGKKEKGAPFAISKYEPEDEITLAKIAMREGKQVDPDFLYDPNAPAEDDKNVLQKEPEVNVPEVNVPEIPKTPAAKKAAAFTPKVDKKVK